jgi:cytochrome c-type biogenesis protein
MASSVTLAGTAGAGLLSFLSPCVLPLVPPYLAYLAGVSLDELQGASRWSKAWWRTLGASAAFVLGFTTVFVGLGTSASVVGQVLLRYREEFGYVAGALIIVMGLHFLGVFRIPLLYREARVQVERRPTGPLGAYVIGLAFGFGWTPCIGPVLSTILAVAATRDSVLEGAGLLAVYSLGLGIPFMAAAVFAGPFMRFMVRFRRHIGAVERVMGGALVLAGVAFMTGQIGRVANWLLETYPALQNIG